MRYLSLLLLAVGLGHAADKPLPATPPILPVEAFFASPSISQLTFSPDGKRMACVVPFEGRNNLAVVDFDKMSKVRLTNLKDQDVGAILWANNQRIIFMSDPGGFENPYIYAINADGTEGVTLRSGGDMQTVSDVSRIHGLLGRIEGDNKYVLVAAGIGQYEYPDICRLHLVTGEVTVLTPNPGRVVSWVLDRDNHPRFGLVALPGARFRIIYRDAGSKKDWETLSEYAEGEEHWMPKVFDGDGHTVYVRTNLGRKTYAIQRYDTRSRALGAIVCEDDTYDCDGTFLYEKKRKKVTGFRYANARERVVMFDEEAGKFSQKLSASIPGYENQVLQVSEDGEKQLIFSRNDRDPGVYYLYTAQTKKIEELAVLKPQLEPGQMARMKPVNYAARDGLILHGYLTLPVGRDAKNLPLVIHPHGGPYGIRDEWGFNPEVQFYANRGFAVLQVNYRGSGGYGDAFERAGYKKWGLEMQDDLTDGVAWLVKQGVADPARVVISGASYGGYAAMAGLVYTPELYCAGINYVGVVDIDLLLPKSAPKDGTWGYRTRIGDRNDSQDRQRIHDTSPVNFVDRIKVPLLIGYGKNDPRVRVDHYYALQKALKSAGKSYESDFQENEGHGFHANAAKTAFYKKIDAFLAKHVPGISSSPEKPADDQK